MPDVAVYVGDVLGTYGFPHGHPFGPDRMKAFWDYATGAGVDQAVRVCSPVEATREVIERFHTHEYVDRVLRGSETGQGLLDQGDTPAFEGCFDAAATVVGTTLHAATSILDGTVRRAFVPIAGLHHARPNSAGGFCIFNDVGVLIDTLREVHGIERIAYVDIDAHHGDGVYYPFEDDPHVIFADIHEDGRFLFPGTGFAREKGTGAAEGLKLNIPVMPGSNDDVFHEHWPEMEALIDAHAPEFIILQAGADSVEGDPLTHMAYTPGAHSYATQRLIALAEKHCDGRILATGGGGYNRNNLAVAWTNVVRELVKGNA